MKDFLFTLLAWILTLPLIVMAVTFAICNAQDVPITYNPFKGETLMPVYVPVLVAIALGFILGALMTWAASGRLRQQRNDQKKKIRLLEKQLRDSGQAHSAKHNYSAIPLALLEKPR